MTFNPRYTITDRLLAQIKRINSLIAELNNRNLPDLMLVELEKTAREVSSYASTSIECNPLPLTEVKKVLKTTPAHIRDSEKEVLNYNQAFENLNKKINKDKINISLRLILDIQGQITTNLLLAHESGKLRKKPIVVNDPRTGETVFLPPDVKDVKLLMEELICYIQDHKNIIDPLILAGMFHKQMVIIHPFMDGNGRATRLTTKVLLAEMGLNTFNLFSFENYYNKNVTKYFQTVGEYGNYYELVEKIDFTPWLEYFTEGIIDELLRVQKLLPKATMTPDTVLHSHHKAILKHIKAVGFIKDKDYAKLTNRAKATRALDFQKLLDLEMIERKGKGRATYYVLKEK